jgi:hypothetical protein
MGDATDKVGPEHFDVAIQPNVWQAGEEFGEDDAELEAGQVGA